MKPTLFALALLPALAWADPAADCNAAGGTLRTGTVVQGPKFAHGQFRKGVELSHTHLKMKSDQDGKVYDVAIDNVFADGFEKNSKQVPASLAQIAPKDRIEACGELYDRGVGIHFVHTNCGARPSATKPDGWLKRIGADGKEGANLEGNQQFCPLFRRGR